MSEWHSVQARAALRPHSRGYLALTSGATRSRTIFCVIAPTRLRSAFRFAATSGLSASALPVKRAALSKLPLLSRYSSCVHCPSTESVSTSNGSSCTRSRRRLTSLRESSFGRT